MLPVVVSLGMVETTADSFRMFVSNGRRTLRARVPRFVSPHGPLQRYSWLDSYCRLLQHDVLGGQFRQEGYIGGVQLGPGRFALLTAHHLIVVLPAHRNETLEAAVALVVATEALFFSRRLGDRVQVAHLYADTVYERLAANIGAGDPEVSGADPSPAGGSGKTGGGALTADSGVLRTGVPRWICLTGIACATAGAAEQLQGLLEGVRGALEQQRRVQPCRMVGF